MIYAQTDKNVKTEILLLDSSFQSMIKEAVVNDMLFKHHYIISLFFVLHLWSKSLISWNTS